MPVVAAAIGLAGSLLATLTLYQAASAAVDQVLDERLRGAGESAARLFAAMPSDARRLTALMQANSLEGAFVVDRSLTVLADATGASGGRVNLLRIDPARIDAAFKGSSTTSAAYVVGETAIAAGYFPVQGNDGHVTAVLALEAGQTFSHARRSLTRALFWGVQLALLGALALAVVAAGWTRTERSRAEAAARAARGETMSKMAAFAAHEIRNPLGVIRGTVELMLERSRADLTTRDREAMSDILGEVDRLRRLTEDLLHLSTDRALNVAPADIPALLADAARAIEVAFPQVRVRRTVDAMPPIPADPERLRQVLTNLLTNAAEAQGPGEIELRAEVTRHELVIQVRDHGPGVSDDVRQWLFDPMRTTKPHGTGLGLVLSRRIVERHGGVLAALAADGPGATFELRLPLAGGARKLAAE